ncbi:LCP family protein [Candidatus Daviesbacteria bacterium]|nr:LCP family protein [Candidatus Daviesbacteria bacterium]
MDFKLKKLKLQQTQTSGFFAKKFEKLLVAVSIIIGCVVVWSILTSTSSVFQFVFSNSGLKSTNDRVNVLLLGIAGGTHAGAQLTDSMIIASYHLKTHQVILISVPRDLWLSSISAKVNAAYEIGLSPKNEGNGLKFAEDKIDDILGVPIHYGVRLDFSGFARAIDLVEGIDVKIPKTFDDFNYPIEGKEDELCGLVEKDVELSAGQIQDLNAPSLNLKPGKNKVLVDLQEKIATSAADFGCRFEHIHFEQGIQHMDGAEALKFVRSRMGTNSEGSDFARSRRQQLVLQSFRDKVLSIQTLTNPQKISELIKTFGKSFETDIPLERFLDFYKLVKDVDGVKSLVLGDLGTGKSILINPPAADYGGAYVLIPPGNDFSIIKEFIKGELEK